MIQLKPLEEKWKNADEATKNQLKELALVEALKSAVSEKQLNEVVANLEGHIKRLQLAEDALNKRVKAIESRNSAHDKVLIETADKLNKSWLYKLFNN